MKTNQRLRGLAQEADIVSKLEGMEVEFDEKVTLFPVELEEIRAVTVKSAQRAGHVRRSLH